jgi:hypothetical protein
MGEIYVLEWTFTPADYFEVELDLACEHGSFRVTSGKVELRLAPEKYPSDHSLRMQLHGELDARFLAAQVLAHQSYTLSKPNVSRLHPDGRKDVWAFAEGATLKISCGSADFVVRDSAGNIVRDTKRERIEHRASFAQLAARYINDPVANALLRSYSAAVNDPRNELVHLYEIRDALSGHFGGEAVATNAVGVSNAQWSRIGQLANNEPFTQGRHRGKQLGVLRDATSEELSEARQIARSMIEGYLRHLEGKSQ